MVKKKKRIYNDDSQFFKDWTDKKLIEEARGYHGVVNVTECYGTRDVIALEGCLRELGRRGYRMITSISFVKENE